MSVVPSLHSLVLFKLFKHEVSEMVSRFFPLSLEGEGDTSTGSLSYY